MGNVLLIIRCTSDNKMYCDVQRELGVMRMETKVGMFSGISVQTQVGSVFIEGGGGGGCTTVLHTMKMEYMKGGGVVSSGSMLSGMFRKVSFTKLLFSPPLIT